MRASPSSPRPRCSSTSRSRTASPTRPPTSSPASASPSSSDPRKDRIMKFTIQNKLFALSGLGLLFVCAVGATGYVAATRLTGAAGKIVDTGAALMTQMTADQDHDALRADVLAALLAGEKKDEAAQKAVREELDAHSKELRDSMKKLESAGLGADALESVRQTGPALLAY